MKLIINYVIKVITDILTTPDDEIIYPPEDEWIYNDNCD